MNVFKIGAALLAIYGMTGSAPLLAQEFSTPGQKTYEKHCSTCHGSDFSGGSGATLGPALRGDAFVAKWRAKPAADFLTYVHERMPAHQPGSLDVATSAAAANYVLEANQLPIAVPAAAGTPSAVTILEGMALPVQSENQDQTYGASLSARRDLLDRLRPVDGARLAAPAAQDWLAWRGAGDTQGFSTLSQIDRTNVTKLGLRWSLSIDSGTNGIAPVVQDGVMFLASGGTVRALDARNGDALWTFKREITGAFIADQPHGIAVYGTSVFVPTVDGHLIALEAKSGKLLWDREVAPGARKLWLTAAPLAAKGKIIQGVSGCSTRGSPGGCYIVALDAATGQEAWRFNTIPSPDEPGGQSWNGAPQDERFGGSVWNTGSYDPALNLIFFGTGQTYNISTLLDPQKGKSKATPDALYTNTTLAIEPDTGKLVWFYQHVPQDVWDLDWAFERTLVTINGQRVVITGGKIAIFDALDAKTGRYLWSYDFGLQNLVTKIDARTGRKSYDAALRPELDKHKFICPGTIGNRNWQTTAFNPSSGLLYVPITPTCMDFWRSNSGNWSIQNPGQMAYDMRRPKDFDGHYGWLAALDLVQRKVVWTQKWRTPQSSAALTTAGGLVFDATRDRVLRAMNDSTGETLWKARLPALPNAYPISYMIDGTQYVAIVAGGGTAFDSVVRGLTPEEVSASDHKTIVVFALPGAE